MAKIKMIRENSKEKYYLDNKELEISEKLRLKMRNDSGEWEEFVGTVADGALVAPAKSLAGELWVTIPGFHDFSVSYLHGSSVDMTRI